MNTFCVMPWYSSESGYRTTPCHYLADNYDLDRVKQDLLHGRQSPDCERCWAAEREGQNSRRLGNTRFLEWRTGKKLLELKQAAINGTASPMLYHLSTGNLCNRACVMCNSRDSSLWEEIEKKSGQIIFPSAPGMFPNFDLDWDVLNNVDHKNAKKIVINTSGEPLLHPATWDLLEKLYAAGNTDCYIVISTNGGLSLSPIRAALFERFSNIEIQFSIDGIEKVFEYMRWPGIWERLPGVIDEYRQIVKKIYVNYTVSSLNAYYRNQTISWFNAQGLEYTETQVEYPTWLSMDVAPGVIKQLVGIPLNGREMDVAGYREKLQLQDTLKGIRMADYLPEVAAALKI